MASIRQQAISAIIARIDASGKPANLVVGRSWGLIGDLINEPDTIAVVVKLGKEANDTKGGPRNFVADRTSFVILEIVCNAADGESWDQTADPIQSWIIRQLGDDRTLGGLVKFVDEKETVWVHEDPKNDKENGRVHWLWSVQHYTKGNDQEAKP